RNSGSRFKNGSGTSGPQEFRDDLKICSSFSRAQKGGSGYLV
ncbi:unnamed protein product, partial [marine sediment metagenome]